MSMQMSPSNVGSSELVRPSSIGVPPVPVALSNIDSDRKAEFLELWRSVVKRRWLILALAAACAVLAGAISFAMTPIYRSTVTVLIEAGKGKILSIEDVYSVNSQREHYQTQVEIIKSREVLERVVKSLQLWKFKEFDPTVAEDGFLASMRSNFGFSAAAVVLTEPALVDAVVLRLTDRVSVDPVRLSQLVRVSVESKDSALGARIANSIATEYIGADRDAKFKMSQEVSSFLQERLGSLRETLTKSEAALQDYRERKGIVALGGSASTMSNQQAFGTMNNLLAARARKLELESSYQQIRAARGGDFSGVGAVLRDAAVIDALAKYNDAKAKLSEAGQSLGASHPRFSQMENEVLELRRSLNIARQAVVDSLVRDYEVALRTEQSLERALGNVRTDVQSINREEFELAVLERDVLTNRQLYEMFMSRAKETNLAGDVQANVARIVDAAVPAVNSVRPKKGQLIILTAVGALVVGALVSILLDRLDNTVKGPEDAEQRLSLPVLSAVPQVKDLDRGRLGRYFLDDNHSHYAEAIRTARTGILLSGLDVKNKILLVTSTVPGEGKTTLSLNLAHAHAQTKNTLLIDCDMRRSQASRSADLPPGAKGITNFVAGAPLEECIYRVKDSPLMMMPVGDLPPNPLEVLLSNKFKEALASLAEHFEMVIIDSPPVELVSDSLVLAPMVTNIAYVVKAMSTPAPLVRKNLVRLQRAGGKILGVVVNDLDFEAARMYYGEYGAATYSYGGYSNGKLTYGGSSTAKAAEGGGSPQA
jgi:capsular exopolysaccharide synthesis family protein